MKRILSATLVLSMPLLLMACGGRPREAVYPPSTIEATNTPFVAQPAVEAEEYDLGQASDLSGLNSYRVHYTFKWESTKAGQKESGSWEVLEEFVRQTSAHHLVWTSTTVEAPGKFELIQIGKDTYINTGSGVDRHGYKHNRFLPRQSLFK